jgi:hypothetical protein
LLIQGEKDEIDVGRARVPLLNEIRFRDLDGHMLEFISILPDPPDPNVNLPYSEWKKLTRPSQS